MCVVCWVPVFDLLELGFWFEMLPWRTSSLFARSPSFVKTQFRPAPCPVTYSHASLQYYAAKKNGVLNRISGCFDVNCVALCLICLSRFGIWRRAFASWFIDCAVSSKVRLGIFDFLYLLALPSLSTVSGARRRGWGKVVVGWYEFLIRHQLPFVRKIVQHATQLQDQGGSLTYSPTNRPTDRLVD